MGWDVFGVCGIVLYSAVSESRSYIPSLFLGPCRVFLLFRVSGWMAGVCLAGLRLAGLLASGCL